MTPERWKQVEGLYHTALELKPGERSAYLDQSCAGDEELRREVASLLASHEQARTFIESPPDDVVAGMLAEEQAHSMISTDPGRVVGTPRYMAPEQIRGQQVDARADIFSLGVALYEMITGRAPFEGATPSEVIAAILHVDPMPMARFSLGAPAELERIVKKALRKDRDERYQVVKDLQLDLKSFKEEMVFEARLASALRSTDRDETMGKASGGQAGIETAQQPAAGSENVTAHAVSSAEYLAVAVSRHKRAALALAALAVIIPVLAFAWIQWREERRPSAPFRMDKITRLTTAGKAGRVAVISHGRATAGDSPYLAAKALTMWR
jgi:Protein kinase domain